MAAVERVVIMVQENHTTDNYFRGLAPYGADVATDWPIAANPPASDNPHDRHAYFEWLTGASTGAHVQFDTASVLPYYLYLAVTGAFLEGHCAGFGTNSTANHLLIVGGQSPTLKNPSSRSPAPLWDMPSLPGLAQAHNVAWRAYAASNDYPVGFYTELKGSPNIVPSAQFVTDAKAGRLPALVMLWHNSPYDGHPRANVTEGMDRIWQSADAKPGIDSRWCSHVSIPKTAMQLLGLPALGVPRLDDDPGLADLVDPAQSPTAPPPTYVTPITVPPAPSPPVAPKPPPPPPPGNPVPVPDVILRNGSTLPPPNDAPLPQQPNPPSA